MPPGRNYSGAVICGLVLSIILLSIALATQCWVYGYIMFVDFTIGLFTTSVDGTVYNTQDLYPGLKGNFNCTFISFLFYLFLFVCSFVCLFFVCFRKPKHEREITRDNVQTAAMIKLTQTPAGSVHIYYSQVDLKK